MGRGYLGEPLQGTWVRACNGMENGIEWKENFDMEYGRCSEWNGMGDLKNGMKDCLPYSLNIFKLTTNYKVMP